MTLLEKPALAQYPIHDLLRRRWSPRAFSSQSVSPAQLASLLEAARWAASCFNQQPWFFVVATRDHPQDFSRLLDCLVESNQAWARQAPVLMLSVAKLTFDQNGHANRHALHDVGQAAANLTVQATAMGLVVHQMAGFDTDKARTAFGIPDGYEPVAALAVGYQGDPAALSPKLREREEAPRTRKPLRDFVFSGRWGAPTPLTGL
jgi:nitroreductase